MVTFETNSLPDGKVTLYIHSKEPGCTRFIGIDMTPCEVDALVNLLTCEKSQSMYEFMTRGNK